MKKMILSLLAVTLISIPAFAASTLKFERQTPAVKNAPAKRIRCSISSDKLEIKTLVGKDLNTRELNVAYNSEIKNSDALSKLMNKAILGEVISAKCMPPSNADIKKYSILNRDNKGKSKESILLLSYNNSCATFNLSPEAKVLEKFLDFNCSKQN